MGNLFDFFRQFSAYLKKGRVDYIPVIGVDITDRSVRMTELTLDKGIWSLSKFGAAVVDPFVVEEDAIEMEILRAVKRIFQTAQFSTDKVAVSIPISTAIVKVINIPLLRDEEIEQAVSNGTLWESSIHLPSALSDYSVFWQVVRRDSVKNEMSILFVASKKDLINRQVDLLKKAGLDVLVVDVRCFALRNILKTRKELPNNSLTILLEISGSESYMVFVDGELPFIYDIFISDEDILQLRLGRFDEDSPIIGRVVDQIRTAIQAFMAQTDRKVIAPIEFVSELPKIPVFLASIKKQLREYTIQEIKPLEHIVTPLDIRERIIASASSPSVLTASLGLATRQLDVTGSYKYVTSVSNINLLPGSTEKIGLEAKKGTWLNYGRKLGSIFFVMGLLEIIIAVGLNLFTGISMERSQMEAMVTDIEARKVSLEKESIEIIGYVNKRALKNTNILNLTVLKDLPPSILVKEVKLNAEGVSQLVLISRQPQAINAYIARLSKDPSLKTVKLESVELDATQVGRKDISVAKVSMVLQ